MCRGFSIDSNCCRKQPALPAHLVCFATEDGIISPGFHLLSGGGERGMTGATCWGCFGFAYFCLKVHEFYNAKSLHVGLVHDYLLKWQLAVAHYTFVWNHPRSVGRWCVPSLGCLWTVWDTGENWVFCYPLHIIHFESTMREVFAARAWKPSKTHLILLLESWWQRTNYLLPVIQTLNASQV